MRKLCEVDRPALLEYIADEPEMNLFFFGDIENFGLEGENCEVFALENGGGWDAVLLRYLRSYIVYSKTGCYDAVAMADFLRAQPGLNVLSGKTSSLEPLKEYFPDFKFSVTYMSRCTEAKSFQHKAENVELRRMTPDDAAEVVRLFCRIDEFKDSYVGREKESEEEERVSLGSGATCIGAFHDGELVSYAQTNAENSKSAMVIGVTTLPEWRGLGLASAIVSQLCNIQFEAGKSFVCLFYNNPAAGRIYNRIGFKEIGEYILARPKKEGQE